MASGYDMELLKNAVNAQATPRMVRPRATIGFS